MFFVFIFSVSETYNLVCVCVPDFVRSTQFVRKMDYF